LTETTADSAIVVFGAASSVQSTEKAAIDAALEIQKKTIELNKIAEEEALPPIYVSIGIATGMSYCGAVGLPRLAHYTVLGRNR
jgi:class 3 adenylate cyclase